MLNSLFTWWRHQMETFSVLLALRVRNSLVTGEFPAQRPVTLSLDVFFDLRLNKRLSKQSWGWWFETSCSLWCNCNGCSGYQWKNIKAPHYWPCLSKSNGDWWIPLTKGHWKCFYVMAFSCWFLGRESLKMADSQWQNFLRFFITYLPRSYCSLLWTCAFRASDSCMRKKKLHVIIVADCCVEPMSIWSVFSDQVIVRCTFDVVDGVMILQGSFWVLA